MIVFYKLTFLFTEPHYVVYYNDLGITTLNTRIFNRSLGQTCIIHLDISKLNLVRSYYKHLLSYSVTEKAIHNTTIDVML